MSLDEALVDLIQRPESLKRMLAERGRSQSGLARHLGLDKSGVNRLVNGGRELKAREVEEIRAYLEATKRSSKSGGLVDRIECRPNGRVAIDIKAEVSVGVAAQILALIEGDKA